MRASLAAISTVSLGLHISRLNKHVDWQRTFNTVRAFLIFSYEDTLCALHFKFMFAGAEGSLEELSSWDATREGTYS